jgi:hypothetical protein
MTGRPLAITILLAALASGSIRVGGAAEVEPCFNQPVTIVAQGGITHGTDGPDVILGSPGDDVNDARGVDDFVCDFAGTNRVSGVSGDDHMHVTGVVEGGAGDDDVLASGAGGKAYGGSGGDFVTAITDAAADGGSGNDRVIGIHASTLNGGSGSDVAVNTIGNPKNDCGSAYDLVDANGATDVRRCEDTTTHKPSASHRRHGR